MVRHQVAPGDTLWSIAKQHLSVSRERSPKKLANRRIAADWLRVIAANARTLVSGDPDLLYPGEVIVLLPVA
jgi:nucleoid-associated protein YgaU